MDITLRAPAASDSLDALTALLRRACARLGFVDVDAMQWRDKIYRCVIKVKPLNTPLQTAADLEHRCAMVRSLWAHIQAHDWAAMRQCFADKAVMHWPCTQERFDDADAFVHANAQYPEGWSIHVIAVDALADGRIRSVVRVDHGEQSFFANYCFTLAGLQIRELNEYWGTVEDLPAWRTRDRLGPGYHRQS